MANLYRAYGYNSVIKVVWKVPIIYVIMYLIFTLVRRVGGIITTCKRIPNIGIGWCALATSRHFVGITICVL